MTHPQQLRRLNAYRAVRGAWQSPVLLACSGGVDSTALLFLAISARDAGAVGPFAVAHVDHRTRPGTSDEGQHVADLCLDFGVPFVRCTVAETLETANEDDLRTARYEALASAAHRLGVSAVVTAHTADDQVETVLMRLFAGASGTSLAGMRPARILNTASGPVQVRRPLLGTRRSELQQVLVMLGIDPVVDPSNSSRQYRRNGVRLDVIPAIESVFPGFRGPLLRSVELAKRDAEALDALAGNSYTAIAIEQPGRIVLDRAHLRELPPALASRVVRLAAMTMHPDEDQRELTYERTEAVLQAVAGRSGTTIELPYGVIVRITRHEVIFRRAGGRGGEAG